MSESISIPERQPVYMTPYLPNDAKVIARNWEREHKMPALVLAFEMREGQCPNCADLGLVYLRLLGKGPYKTPFLSKKVVTWYDGGPEFGKGWYLVDDTLTFPCPECGKKGSNFPNVH